MKCKTCHKEMYSYYGAWCPTCEKPEYNSTKYLNLLQCLMHVDRIHFGITNQNKDAPGRQEVWSLLFDCGYIKNDSFVSINFNTTYNDCVKYGPLGDEGLTYLKTFVDTFDLEDERNVLWEISW